MCSKNVSLICQQHSRPWHYFSFLFKPRSLPWEWEVLQNWGHLAEAPWNSWLHAWVCLSWEWQRGVDLQTCGWVCKPPAFQATILSLSIWIVHVRKCQYEAAYNQTLTHTVMYIGRMICQKFDYVWDNCKYLPTVQTGWECNMLAFLGSSSCVYSVFVMVGWLKSPSPAHSPDTAKLIVIYYNLPPFNLVSSPDLRYIISSHLLKAELQPLFIVKFLHSA